METTHDTRARSLRRAWCRAWEKARSLTATARVLLQAIYRRLGNDLFCWPSQSTLATDAGISERSVRRWLPRLEQAGWITRSKRITQRGQITDLIQIALPGQEDFLCLRGGQPVRPSPAKLAAEKDSEEKASETSSEAAGAAADRQAKATSTRKTPTLGYVRELLRLWEELVPQRGGKPSPAPNAELLGHYSAAELQTALAVLLVRMRRRVRSPKGLFERILEGTHQGEREPRSYTAAELRRVAQGVLPEHTQRVRRRQDHPVAPEAETEPVEVPETTSTRSPSPSARPSTTPTATPSAPTPPPERTQLLAIVENTKVQTPGVLERLAREATDIFLAARLLAQQWGWSEGVAFGELHRTKEALLAGGVL